jgi:pimeloyl-ACP methyl ester carboxylesterase
MNGYADDLASVIEALDLKDVTLVGHSTGGGEVARYIGRHGTKRCQGGAHRRSTPDQLSADRGVIYYTAWSGSKFESTTVRPDM